MQKQKTNKQTNKKKKKKKKAKTKKQKKKKQKKNNNKKHNNNTLRKLNTKYSQKSQLHLEIRSNRAFVDRGGSEGVRSNPLWLKISFPWEISDKFGTPYLP